MSHKPTEHWVKEQIHIELKKVKNEVRFRFLVIQYKDYFERVIIPTDRRIDSVE